MEKRDIKEIVDEALNLCKNIRNKSSEELIEIMTQLEVLLEESNYDENMSQIYSSSLIRLTVEQDLKGREESVEKLKEIVDKYPENEKIAVQYARGLCSLSEEQDSKGMLKEIEESVEKIKEIVDKYPENEEIAVQYAMGLVKLDEEIAFCYEEGFLVKEEVKGSEESVEKLKEVVDKYPKNEKIAIRYGQGLLNLVKKTSLKENELILKEFEKLEKEFCDNEEIRIQYAKAVDKAFNRNDLGEIKEAIEKLEYLKDKDSSIDKIMDFYIEALYSSGYWENLELLKKMSNKLGEILYEYREDDEEIARFYAESLIEIIKLQSQKAENEDIKKSIKENTKELENLAQQFEEDEEIATNYSKSLVYLISNQNFKEIEESTEKLERIFERFNENEEIPTNYTEALVCLISNQNLKEIEESIEKVERVFERFNKNKEIATNYIQGLSIEILKNGDEKKIKDNLIRIEGIKESVNHASILEYAKALAYSSFKKIKKENIDILDKIESFGETLSEDSDIKIEYEIILFNLNNEQFIENERKFKEEEKEKIYKKIANIYFELKNFDKALEFYNKAFMMKLEPEKTEPKKTEPKESSKVELLCVWIKKTENNSFEDSKLVFTDKYDIDIRKKANKYEIDIRKKANNIFDTGCISNVTALVGSNGSGKTRILTDLHEKGIEPVDGDDFFKGDNYKRIQIFESNSKIVVEHNMNENVIVNNKLNENNEEEIIEIRKNMANSNDQNNPTNQITKIYLTNAYPSQKLSSSIDKTQKKIPLTMQQIDILSRSFFEKNIKVERNGSIEYNTLYSEYNNELFQLKRIEDFQSICDVLYSEKLENNSIFSNILKEIKVYFKSVLDIKLEIERKNINTERFKEYTDRVFNENSNSLIENLMLNLKFELSYISQDLSCFDFNIKMNKAKLNLPNISTLDKNEMSSKYSDYYKNALLEIYELDTILKEVYTEGEVYNKKEFTINTLENKERKILKFIDKLVRKDYSFILKYIQFEGLKVSSGERAMLNFFSWINLIPFLNKLDSNIIDSTEKNILLLIDEMDLYCHPEWQRKFINSLLEELENQFKDKYIQIIFSTHSPIMLSDMPKGNVIFLENGKVNENIESKTFGQNIHTLFRSSFFLESTIGEFASKQIKDVIQDLTHKTKEELEKDTKRKEEIEYIISIIGEPIIKRKLELMYKEIFPENIKDYKMKIKKLEKEKQNLLKLLDGKDKDSIDSIMELLNQKIKELKSKIGDKND